MKLNEIQSSIYQIKQDYEKADPLLKQRMINRLRASPIPELNRLADELEDVQTLVSWLKPI